MTYNMPPWVGQPANPAEHYATGFQVGVRLGAQQAANAMQQQQMALERHRALMAQQQQEFENQLNVQALNWKASEMARKHQANAEFRARVAAGEDPSNVLMQLAPELGESAAGVLHDRRMLAQNRDLMGFREANMERLRADTASRLEQKDLDRQQREALAKERADLAKEKEERLVAKDKAAALAKIAKDEDMVTLSGDVRRAKRAIQEIKDTRWYIDSHKKAAESKATENLKTAEAAYEQRRRELMTEYGLEPIDLPVSPLGEPASFGDQNMPDQPTVAPEASPAPKMKRLRWTPNGLVEVK